MVRTYGNSPYKAAVIHGGPGAPGYMAPVARDLSKSFGVLEPIQTAKTLEGQINELHRQLKRNCSDPVCLIGSSWGAALALLYVAKFKGMVNKVILVGSCVYDSNSSERVKAIRSERMSAEEKQKSAELSGRLVKATKAEKNEIFSRLAECSFTSDTYDPITRNLELIKCYFDSNKSVWADFKLIRDKPGELKNIFSKVDVPVVNIHGSHDPHILEGIQPFLKSCISELSLHWLEKCGHYPWIERAARDQFFKILQEEVSH